MKKILSIVLSVLLLSGCAIIRETTQQIKVNKSVKNLQYVVMIIMVI